VITFAADAVCDECGAVCDIKMKVINAHPHPSVAIVDGSWKRGWEVLIDPYDNERCPKVSCPKCNHYDELPASTRWEMKGRD